VLFGVLLADGGPAAVASGLWLGLAVGAFVATVWLLLALALDLLARERPTRRRLAWTAVVGAVSIVVLFLALAAGAGGRGGVGG
jgi:hypothetical protein